MITRPTICAGILAGGEGRRFGGVDKGWVLSGGRPMIEIVLDQVRGQVDEIVVSANRSLERYRALGVRVVADGNDGFEGPFAGIVTLLEAARAHEWLLLVPCDAVRLPEGLAHRLLAAAGDADAAALHDGQRLHPLFSLIRTRLADPARQAWNAGERSPRLWLERQRLALWPGDTPVNVNSPEDL